MVLNLNGNFIPLTHLTIMANHWRWSVLIRSFKYRTFLLLSGRETLDFIFLSALQVYETPCLIPMVIVATRMHRHLVDFAFKPSDLYEISSLSFSSRSGGRCRFRAHENPQVSKIVFARARETDTTATMLNRIEVTVHTAFDEHPTAEINDDGSSDMGTNDQGSQIACGTIKLDLSQSSSEIHTPSADRLSVSSASTNCLTLLETH